MQFEWDPAKRVRNLELHRIDFVDAALAFSGPLLVRKDARHDYGEDRYRALGEVEGRILEVVFTRRGDSARIISAWPASRRRRRDYRALFPS